MRKFLSSFFLLFADTTNINDTFFLIILEDLLHNEFSKKNEIFWQQFHDRMTLIYISRLM